MPPPKDKKTLAQLTRHECFELAEIIEEFEDNDNELQEGDRVPQLRAKLARTVKRAHEAGFGHAAFAKIIPPLMDDEDEAPPPGNDERPPSEQGTPPPPPAARPSTAPGSPLGPPPRRRQPPRRSRRSRSPERPRSPALSDPPRGRQRARRSRSRSREDSGSPAHRHKRRRSRSSDESWQGIGQDNSSQRSHGELSSDYFRDSFLSIPSVRSRSPACTLRRYPTRVHPFLSLVYSQRGSVPLSLPAK
jgi:hypothetical protein